MRELDIDLREQIYDIVICPSLTAREVIDNICELVYEKRLKYRHRTKEYDV